MDAHSYERTPVHLETCWMLVAELEAGSSQSSFKTHIMWNWDMCVYIGADFNDTLENQSRLSEVCGSSGLEQVLHWMDLSRFYSRVSLNRMIVPVMMAETQRKLLPQALAKPDNFSPL